MPGAREWVEIGFGKTRQGEDRDGARQQRVGAFAQGNRPHERVIGGHRAIRIPVREANALAVHERVLTNSHLKSRRAHEASRAHLDALYLYPKPRTRLE